MGKMQGNSSKADAYTGAGITLGIVTLIGKLLLIISLFYLAVGFLLLVLGARLAGNSWMDSVTQAPHYCAAVASIPFLFVAIRRVIRFHEISLFPTGILTLLSLIALVTWWLRTRTTVRSSKSTMTLEDNSSYLNQAHQRAQRRKSPWNLLLGLFCLIGIGGTWIGIARLLLEYRRFFLIPSDAFLFSGTRIGNILALVTPAFPSLAIGFIVGNFLIWSVPPARATLEREGAGVRGAGFQSSQLALATFRRKYKAS
jgi:hypothetical protein